MPIADDELERAFRASAPAVDTAGVVERVTAKRARRRATRAVGASVVAATLAFVLVGGILLMSGDRDARVTTPAATAPGVDPLVLTSDEGYLRGPLTMSGGLVSVAAYDGDGKGGFRFPPSTIVRFDPDTLQVRDRVALQAEILSVADGPDGVRWAITRNPDPEGPVMAGIFLKRIAPDGGERSFPLPPGTEITGDVSVQGAMVVVPTKAGLLAFGSDGRPRSASAPLAGRSSPSLPTGFVALRTRWSGPRTWIEGTRNGVPSVVLQSDGKVVDTITLPGGTDVSFAWVDDDTVLATSGGRLLQIDVDD